MDQKFSFILALIITILIAGNVFLFDKIEKKETQAATILRVIDGDTIETDKGTIRFLNINTPEKKEIGYEEAKTFLKQFENRTVELQITGTDKYERILARVYTPEYLNLKLVEEGLAKKFLVEESELKLFSEAENQAIENEKGVWKKSVYFGCIQSEINPEKEIILISNSCDKIDILNWRIQDESRKKFNLSILLINQIKIHTKDGISNSTDIFLSQKQDVWNNDRDTLYLFDSEDSLVNHNAYGY